MRSKKTEETNDNSFETNALSEGDVRKLVQVRKKLAKNLEKQVVRAYIFEAYYAKFTGSFKENDEGGLVEAFNKDAGVNTWTAAMGDNLFAVSNEIEKIGNDCWVVEGKSSLCTESREKPEVGKLKLEKGGNRVQRRLFIHFRSSN